MNRESLNILLKKAYYQQLSEEERKTLKLWLGESGENTEMYKRLMSGQSLTEYSDWVTGFDLSRAMEAIRSKVKRNRQRRIRKSVSWVAACVILCLGITFVFYFTSMDSEQVLTEQMAAQIQPGSAKAILTLGDGRQVALDKKPIELLVNKQQMVTGDSATLNYSIVLPASETEQIQRQEVAEYHTIEVPAGGEYHLVLADGTKIWLNAESSLVFPVEFSGNKRQVILKGEAYFQVAHDRQKAFVVVTDDIEVKVYGTEFNINTRVADYVQTTLVRGAVSIKTERSAEKMLKPGQLAQFDRLIGETEIKNVDVSNYIGWKSGVYIFEDKSIEQIMDELSLWYDIEVFFRNNISRNRHFSGSLPRYREIDDMLKVIEKTSHVRFEVKGKTIIVD